MLACVLSKVEDDFDDVELDDFLSPPKLMLERLIKVRIAQIVSVDQIEAFLERLEKISFPNNPLDDLIVKVKNVSKCLDTLCHVCMLGCSYICLHVCFLACVDVLYVYLSFVLCCSWADLSVSQN